jgi:HK97 family phage prohead protease
MSTPKIERRTLSASEISSTSPGKLGGYAALYNSVADLGQFREKILPGAFRSCVARKDDIRLLREHDPTSILARTASGTLRVYNDYSGLRFEADVADTSCGRDTLTLVKRGDLLNLA